MTSVPQLFATPLSEAWDELFLLAPDDSLETYIKLDLPQEVSKKRATRTPSSHYKKSYIDKNLDSPLPGMSGSKSSAQRATLQHKFFSLIVKEGLRIRNRYFHKLKIELDDETLLTELWEYVPTAMAKLEITTPIRSSYEMAMDGESSSKYWLEHGNIDRQIRNAIFSTGEMWDEKKLPALHAASRRGGLANKFENVSAYLETLGMTHAAAGRVLRWDYRTVKAMRDHFGAMTKDEILELAEQEDSADGYELSQAHSSISEAGRVRGELGEETKSHSVELARDDMPGRNGQIRNSRDTSQQPPDYRGAEYLGVVFDGALPF